MIGVKQAKLPGVLPIPPLHGNGRLVLSKRVIFHYKQRTYYSPRGQFTIHWDDPKFGFWWPTKQPIVSRRDEAGRFI